MAHDPTYTNFHIARGSAEDENVYSNFCNHQRGSGALRGKQGWRREVTCGGWTILCGRACFIYCTVTVIFFITLFLLISCLASVKDLNKKMTAKTVDSHNKNVSAKRNTEDLSSTLNLTQQNFSQLEELPQTIHKEVTRWNSTVSQLEELPQTIHKEVTRLNSTVSQLEKLWQTIQEEVNYLNSTVSQLEKLRKTIQEEVINMNNSVSQLMKFPQTIQEEVKRLNSSGWTDLYQNVSTLGGKCYFSSDKSDCCNAGKQCTLMKFQIAVDNKVCSKTTDSISDGTGKPQETTSVSSITATSLNQDNSKTQGN